MSVEHFRSYITKIPNMTLLLYFPQMRTLSRAEPIGYESFELLCSADARLSQPILIVIDHTPSSSTLGKLRTRPMALATPPVLTIGTELLCATQVDDKIRVVIG